MCRGASPSVLLRILANVLFQVKHSLICRVNLALILMKYKAK